MDKKKFFTDFKKYLPLLYNLASKDFKLKYRRSILGVLWSILNPLFTMLVISKVFGALLKIEIPDFSTYYIVGWSIWNFFSEATNLSMSSILQGAPLIKKVYLPKYIFPLEKCLFALVNFAFSLIAVIAVMCLQQVFGGFTNFTIFLAPIPVLLCLVFCIGMSLLLSALTVFFRDIQHLYGVLLTVWMYLTPIIYPMYYLKDHPTLQTIVQCNPMYYYVEYFRNVVMYGQIPDLSFNLITVAISFGTLLFGAFVFSKAQKRFILHI